MDIKLGSHNSWTFAPKRHWWFPAFMARCQNKTIQQQYEAGVRLFDLRLKFYKGKWEVAHGYCLFKADWLYDLLWLSHKNEDIYVRVFLEYNNHPKYEETLISEFWDLCRYLERRFSTIKFFGGVLKCKGTVYYFDNKDIPVLLDRYSSMTSLFTSESKLLKIIDDWWPWLYARLRNRKNIEWYKDNSPMKEWLFIDFVK